MHKIKIYEDKNKQGSKENRTDEEASKILTLFACLVQVKIT
jgi:hypothetical protein